MESQFPQMLSGALGLFDLGDYDAALKLYSNVLEQSQRLGNKWDQATALYGLGGAYFCLERLDQAYRYLVEGLYVYGDIGDKHGEATVLDDLGAVCRGLGRVEDSFERYTQAKDLFIDLGDEAEVKLCFEKLNELSAGAAKNFLEDGNVVAALFWVNEAIESSRYLNDNKKIATARGLKEALLHLKKTMTSNSSKTENQ